MSNMTDSVNRRVPVRPEIIEANINNSALAFEGPVGQAWSDFTDPDNNVYQTGIRKVLEIPAEGISILDMDEKERQEHVNKFSALWILLGRAVAHGYEYGARDAIERTEE